MKKTKIGLVLLGAIATMGLTPVLADDNSPPPPAQEKPEKESQKFQGKVDSVDAKVKSLTVDRSGEGNIVMDSIRGKGLGRKRTVAATSR